MQESLLDTRAAFNIINPIIAPADCNVSQEKPQLFTAKVTRVSTGGQVRLPVTPFKETSLVDSVILSNSVFPIIWVRSGAEKNGLFRLNHKQNTHTCDGNISCQYFVMQKYLRVGWVHHALCFRRHRGKVRPTSTVLLSI